MNKFFLLLTALALAFVSGWLFGNEVRPPMLANANLAMWLAIGGGSVINALIASMGR